MDEESLKILLASHERQLKNMKKEILSDIGFLLAPACEDMRDIIAMVVSGKRAPEELIHFWNHLNGKIAEISPLANHPL
jgi:hypothetical protein